MLLRASNGRVICTTAEVKCLSFDVNMWLERRDVLNKIDQTYLFHATLSGPVFVCLCDKINEIFDLSILFLLYVYCNVFNCI